MYALRKTQNKKTPWYRKRLLAVLLALVLIVGVVAALEFTDTTEFFHKADRSLATQPTTPDRTAGPSTKGEPKKTQTQSPKEGDNSSAPGSNVTLKKPEGNFVSNHHPNMDGSPNPNQIQSVCVTSPGATCTIVFTKNNETKQLPAQATDGEGAAYWTWKLQDIGLSEGSWTVQAKAQLGSQQEVASDAMNLEVQP